MLDFISEGKSLFNSMSLSYPLFKIFYKEMSANLLLPCGVSPAEGISLSLTVLKIAQYYTCIITATFTI